MEHQSSLLSSTRAFAEKLPSTKLTKKGFNGIENRKILFSESARRRTDYWRRPLHVQCPKTPFNLISRKLGRPIEKKGMTRYDKGYKMSLEPHSESISARLYLHLKIEESLKKLLMSFSKLFGRVKGQL